MNIFQPRRRRIFLMNFTVVHPQSDSLHKQWQFYDGMHVVFQPKCFTPVELQQGMIDCFSDFYSYTNGINDAINIFFETCLTLIKRMYKKTYYPSFFPSLVKIAGKKVVKNWIMHNTPYMGYLHTITMNNTIQSQD